MEDVVIAIHGGAFFVPIYQEDDVRAGIQIAARTGYQVLARGGSAVDAVEAAVASMEDNPCFNCGTGSVLTKDGTIEMDSFIMDGLTQNVGSIASVSDVKNPIKLARVIMEKTDHCLMVGKGASRIAEKEGLERVTIEDLLTDEAVQRLDKTQNFNDFVDGLCDLNGREHDTVGAVALDCHGNLAAATSTGGITGKLAGRVGDAPLCGSGGWAEANVGAVCISGQGEAIMRVCLARRVASNMEAGLSPQEASEEGLNHMKKRVKGYGGLISINNLGDVGVAFSTDQMTWAYVKKQKIHHGIHVGEHLVEPW